MSVLIEQLSDRNCIQTCIDKIQDDRKWIQSITVTKQHSNTKITLVRCDGWRSLGYTKIHSQGSMTNRLTQTQNFYRPIVWLTANITLTRRRANIESMSHEARKIPLWHCHGPVHAACRAQSAVCVDLLFDSVQYTGCLLVNYNCHMYLQLVQLFYVSQLLHTSAVIKAFVR